MVLRDPVFDLAVKLRSLDEDLRRFGLGSNIGEGVVDSISLSPTGLKIIGVLVGRLPNTSFTLSNDRR
jgi:hypothetical protein